MVCELNNPASSQIIELFDDILKRGVGLRIKVTGKSMAPFLKGGEVLTIKQEPCLSLNRGDLILYRNRYDLPVLHRIIKKRKAADETFRVVTKGDALFRFDEEIDSSKVMGKVCSIERSGPAGKIRCINMNSKYRKALNFLIATLAFYRTQTRFLLSAAVAKIT
jgi:signal peptidase I